MSGETNKRLVSVSVGSSIEYYEVEGEGDIKGALMILRPYGEDVSPAAARVDRDRHAREIAERLKPAKYAFGALPESLGSMAYKGSMETNAGISGRANL